MNLTEYQTESKKTAIYGRIFVEKEPGKLIEASWIYPALGLAGESGETLEKLKKIIRDKGAEYDENDRLAVRNELGDTLWYLARIAEHFNLTLGEVATANVAKLMARQARGVLHGAGDNR